MNKTITNLSLRAAMTLLVLLTAATGAWAANPGTYSDLIHEIGSGGNIVLSHDYYTYDSGSTIIITTDNSVIDGNGAVIDMAGSDIRAFYVGASDVTIKNLTIINCARTDGRPIYFEKDATLTNVLCNPCGDGVTWAFSDYMGITLTINYTGSGTGTMQDYNDPGDPNEDNRPWKGYCSYITRVVIGDGVKHIGNNAFNNCSELGDVTIYAASVPTLGTDVFSGNKNGRKIYVFSDLVNDYQTAWSTYANDIEAITPIASGTCGKDDPQDVTWQVVGEAGYYTLYISGTGAMQDWQWDSSQNGPEATPWDIYKADITRLVIGDGVTHIGDYSFYGHAALTSVSLGAGVTTIVKKYKLYSDLTAIIIPNSVTTIGNGAFGNCLYLTAITIPTGVTDIGQEAFKNCQYLTMVRLLPATPPTMGSDAFDGIGSGVSSGDKMFYFHDTAYGSDTYSDWNDMYNHTGDFSGWSTTVFAKVAYVDADGNLHDDADGIEGTADDMATAIILDGTETTLGMKGTAASPTETWYVCQTPATENGGKGLVYDSDTDGNDDVLTLADYCHVHLILADGCLMTVDGGETIEDGINDGGYGSSLTIYGQGGTDAATGLSTEGALSVNAKDYAIGVVSDLTINGGKVTATGTDNGISSTYGAVDILGGQVEASSVYAGGPGNADYPGGVTLGWTSASDYIKAGSYRAANDVVSIKAGKYLSDGTNVYGSATADYVFGAEGNATLDLIAGKKLVPAKSVEGGVPYVAMTMDDASWVPVGGTMAYLPKSYTEGDSEVALSEPLKGAPKGKPVIYGNVKDGEALTNPFFLVAASETSTDASEGEAERIQADYEAKAAAMDNHFALTDGTKLETVIKGVVEPASDAIVMVLKGGKFRAVDVSGNDLERNTKEGLLLFILSKWEYMQIGSNENAGGSAGTRGIGIADGGATSLTPIPSPTGEGSGAWYDMQGRRIDKPARKGVYIHNGKAVVIK